MARDPATPLTRASLLTVAEATAELGIRPGDAKTWLNERGLIVDLAGRPRVIWGDVLDALRKPSAAPRKPKPVSSPARRAGGWKDI